MWRLLKRRVIIERSDLAGNAPVTVILPVLNEATRIRACLDALIAQSEEVEEILVVDGGSSDATPSIVRHYGSTDPRVRLVDASPVDPRWTGKAWGLQAGLKNSSPRSYWILCVDADVRCSPYLVRSLLSHAEKTGISTFSVATTQRLSGPAEALIHPAMLTTLIYRFGSPGKATKNRHKVQANGQCFLSRRDTLIRTDAFRAAQMSLCEDITIVRRLAECGEAVGFYESDNLVEARMYDNWRDTWQNWPRSLPMRDQYFGISEAAGLLKVLLFQGLPLPSLALSVGAGASLWLSGIILPFVLLRIGILLGVARAYHPRPWTYWLSPFFDLPVALRLIGSAMNRRHVWRGRAYIRRRGGFFETSGISDSGSK